MLRVVRSTTKARGCAERTVLQIRQQHSNRAAKKFKRPQFGSNAERRPLQFPVEEWQAKKVR